ncbi:MAG TPA: hypothetical protein VF658_06180 [Pyrinomonadaceae bacterium]
MSYSIYNNPFESHSPREIIAVGPITCDAPSNSAAMGKPQATFESNRPV